MLPQVTFSRNIKFSFPVANLGQGNRLFVTLQVTKAQNSRHLAEAKASVSSGGQDIDLESREKVVKAAEARGKATVPTTQGPQDSPRTHSGLVVGQGLVASPHQSLRYADLTAQEIPLGRLQRKPLLKSPCVDRVAVSIINNMTQEQGHRLATKGTHPWKAWEGENPSNLLHQSPNQKPIPPKLGENGLENIIEEAEKRWGDTHLPNRLQHCLPWWEKWATPKVCNLIREGIKPQWKNPPPLSVQGRQGENLEQAQKILEDYEKSGAVKRVNPQGTLHLLPCFLISKPEEGGAQNGGSSQIVGK